MTLHTFVAIKDQSSHDSYWHWASVLTIRSAAPAIPSSRDPRWQAPGRASLVPAHAGHRNQLEGVFPRRTKNRANRRTAPIP